MSDFRDNVYLWGHPANSLLGCAGLQKESHVSPIEGARELHATNIFYVPMGHPTDREAEAVKMDETCRSYGFSLECEAQADELIALRKTHPKLTLAVFDDFFRPEYTANNAAAHTIEDLCDVRRRLNEAGIDLWAVYYERDLGLDISAYLPCFDGFACWFWSQPDKKTYEETVTRFVQKTPGKRRLFGCYLYDFGRERPADANEVTYELTRARELVADGTSEGVILHTNAVGGMGFDAYDVPKKML